MVFVKSIAVGLVAVVAYVAFITEVLWYGTRGQSMGFIVGLGWPFLAGAAAVFGAAAFWSSKRFSK